MAERKVLTNYIHPDIDPLALSRHKKRKKQPTSGPKLIEVRTMLPFNLQCDTCKEYMYTGKKFNGKKEIVEGETYMGVKIIRFYIKCSTCSASITFKTDPKTSGYKCEWGASRNFEVWREDKEAAEAEVELQHQQEEADAMMKLESKTLSNKQEMDEIDALEQIRTMNKAHEKLDTYEIIEKLRRNGKEEEEVEDDGKDADGAGMPPMPAKLLSNGLTEEDEALVQRTKFKSRSKSKLKLNQPLSDSDSNSDSDSVLASAPTLATREKEEKKEKNEGLVAPLPMIVSKKRKLCVQEEKPAPPAAASGGALGLLSGYGSDSD